ncbi:uncharacterized protein LOC144751959 [Lissotriton helveticus]
MRQQPVNDKSVGQTSRKASKGGRNRLSLPNARVFPPLRHMSLPNLKDASSSASRAYCQIQPARPVLKDKGNLPKECLRPLQRPPEKQDCRKRANFTEVKKVCASGKSSLAGSLKRRNSTGEICKNLYSFFENCKMEAAKRSKTPLDSTWVRKDSDGCQKMEDSGSPESSIAASEAGSSVCSAWSRTFVVLDDEGNEVFLDSRGLKSHGEVQDKNVAQEEVSSVESAEPMLNCVLPNSGPTVILQHLIPPGAMDTNSILPNSSYFPDCQSANSSVGDASDADNQGSACKYFSTPVATTKPKGKIQLTPVMEVDLELSSTEPESVTDQKPCNLPIGNECVGEPYPDLLQHTPSNQEEIILNALQYRSSYAAECNKIVSEIAGSKLAGDQALQPSSEVSAGPQSSKRKQFMFDYSTIQAEPLPYDLTPMKSMLCHDADKVLRYLDCTEASFFGVSILDLDNMNTQLMEFGSEGLEETKPLGASKEVLDSEPSILSKISLSSSGGFRGLKDSCLSDGLEVAPRESASNCSLDETRTVADRNLNCTVDLHAPASSVLLNTTVTHAPAAHSNQLANGSASNALIPVTLDGQSASKDLNLTVTKTEEQTAANKTQELFNTTLEIGTVSPYKKSEIRVVNVLNTTQDIWQKSHLVSAESNLHLNVTQDILLDENHVDVTEEITEDCNATRDLGDIHGQDLVNEGDTTRDLGASKRQNFLEGNTTVDLGGKHQDSFEGHTTRALGDGHLGSVEGNTRILGDSQDGGNETRDLGDNNQDLEDSTNTTRDLPDLRHPDIQDLGNATIDLAVSSPQDNLGVVMVTRVVSHQDLVDTKSRTIDTQIQEASKLANSANTTHDLDGANTKVKLEEVVSSPTTLEKETMKSEARPVEEVVINEANLAEELSNGEATNQVEGQNDDQLEEAVKLENSTVKSNATTDNLLVQSEAPLNNVVVNGEHAPDEVPSSALEVAICSSASARSAEGESQSHHRPLTRLSSGDSSFVLQPADLSRRSIELAHSESSFSASLSFVTSTPLPGAVAFPFTKGTCSDSGQSNANLSICSLPEESNSVVSEESKSKSKQHKNLMDRTGKSIGKPTAVSTSKMSNLQRSAITGQRNLSKAEVPGRTLPTGLPGARRCLALTSAEKPRVSRETGTTKPPIPRIPTLTKTTSKSFLTNGKSGLPKPGLQPSTLKPAGTSSTSLSFEGQRASSSVLGEQSSRNEGTPPPDLDSKPAQATSAGSAQPVKPSSMMKPPSASKLYRFQGVARPCNRSNRRESLGGEKTFVGGTPTHDSRLSMAGTRPAEDNMSLQAQQAPDGKMSMGPPRNPESRMPLRPPRAADTRGAEASGVPNIKMSLGPQQASDSRMHFVAPRDPDIRMGTPRGPESRLHLGAPQGLGSRMSLAGLRPPSGKMSFGLVKPPDCKLAKSTPAAMENKLSVAVTRKPVGSDGTDIKTSITDARGSHSAATLEGGLMLGGLRPQLYSSKGFGNRLPAASGIAGISGPARNGLALKPPRVTNPKSPASEPVSPKMSEDQAVSQGAALPNDGGPAAKRKSTSIAAPRSTFRSGLKPPTKATLNPSPKRQRLAPPNLGSEPSAPKRPSPGREKEAANATPAKMEPPATGIKRFKRSPLMFGKTNLPSRKDCTETEAHQVPSTMEEVMAEPEAIHTTSAAMEELRPSPEIIHDHTTEERGDGLEAVLDISPIKVDSMTFLESTLKTPDIVAGSALEFNLVLSTPAVVNKPSDEPKILHQTPAIKVEPMTEPGPLHAIASAVQEQCARPEPTTQTALQEQSVFLELIHTTSAIGEEKRNGPESISKTPPLMEPQKTPAAWEEPIGGPVAGSKGSPSKVKPMAESESFYVTPPTSMKAKTTLDSLYNRTPFPMAKNIAESASFFKTPCTVDKRINTSNLTQASHYKNNPASDKSKSDLRTNIPSCMIKKPRNGPYSWLKTPAAEEKPDSWMQSINESPLRESELSTGPETTIQSLSSTAPAQKQNSNFVVNPSLKTEKLSTEEAAIHRSAKPENLAHNMEEVITDLGSSHRTPQSPETLLSSGISQPTLSSPANRVLHMSTGETKGADSLHAPIRQPPASKTAADEVTFGASNAPIDPPTEQQPAPGVEECTRTTYDNDSPCHDIMQPPCSGNTDLDQELEEVKRELAERDIQCEQYVVKVKTLEAECEKYKRKLHLLVTRCECQDLELSLPSPGLEGKRPTENAFTGAECLLHAPGEGIKNSLRTPSQEVEQPLESMKKVVEHSLLVLKKEMEKSPGACFQEAALPVESSSKVDDCSLKTPSKDMEKSPVTPCKGGETLSPGDLKRSQPEGKSNII